MARELSVSEVCAWLRGQAAKFNRMAEEIESSMGVPSVFGGTGVSSKHLTPAAAGNRTMLELDAVRLHEQAKELVRGKSLRKSAIAERLNVTESTLDDVLTPENGWEQGSRGWWSYVGANGEAK